MSLREPDKDALVMAPVLIDVGGNKRRVNVLGIYKGIMDTTYDGPAEVGRCCVVQDMKDGNLRAVHADTGVRGYGETRDQVRLINKVTVTGLVDKEPLLNLILNMDLGYLIDPMTGRMAESASRGRFPEAIRIPTDAPHRRGEGGGGGLGGGKLRKRKKSKGRKKKSTRR